MVSSLVLITIAFLWPHTIKKHPDAKPWQYREFIIFFHIHYRTEFSIVVNLPVDRDIQDFLNRVSNNSNVRNDKDTMHILNGFYSVGPGVCFIIACSFPFGLQVHIIIRRGSPDI